MRRLQTILKLAQAHLRQFFRDPAVLFWAVAFPLVLAGILGVAFGPRSEVQLSIPVVVEPMGSLGINDLPQGETTVRWQIAELPDAQRAIRKGIAPLYAVVSAPEFGQSLTAGQWELIYDPANQQAALAAAQVEATLHAAQGHAAPRTSYITAQGSRYIDFLVPGLLAFGIMNSCLWGVAWVLIEYRMKKLLRRLTATPMRRFDFLLSFVMGRLVVTFFESALLLVFVYFTFDAQIQGSLLAMFLLYLSANYGFGGLAVLCATRAENTQVGNGIVNAVTLPSTILSGVFFSYRNFPDWLVPVLEWLPLSVLADAIRDVYNEGATLAEVVPALAVMFVMGSVCFALGLRIFKWS